MDRQGKVKKEKREYKTCVENRGRKMTRES